MGVRYFGAPVRRLEDPKLLAGGQSLLPAMKLRIARPSVVVDIGALGLSGIDERDGELVIGALTTWDELERIDARPAFRALIDCAAGIGDFQVRNRGTIGGNLCSSDPTNHLLPLMVAMEATMVVTGAAGERRVAADEFFLGVYLTAVGPGELLTRIEIPSGRGDGFASVTIGKDGTCIVNAAASRNGGLRVAIGCVAAVPVLVEPSGEDQESVRAAVHEASLDPPSDVHASADYRRHLAEVLASRAVRQATGS